MRAIFSLISLQPAVLINGMLKKQFGGSTVATPPAPDAASTPAKPVGTQQQQLQPRQRALGTAAVPTRLVASEP